jgi:hypothetical protein
LAYDYPGLSYWTGPDCCIAERAHISYEFFALLGEIPVAVMDSLYNIDVFGMGGPEEGSALSNFLRKCAEKRFPQRLIEYRPKESLVKLLLANEGLFKKVEKEFALKID